MNELESIFLEAKERCDKNSRKLAKIAERRKSIREANRRFVMQKLDFVTKHGGKFHIRETDCERDWITIISPRGIMRGSVKIPDTRKLNDNSTIEQTFEKNFARPSKFLAMTWDELARAIGISFSEI